MEIIRVTPGTEAFRQFMEVPLMVYPSGSLRLQQQEDIPTDHLVTGVVALRNKQPVGRVAVYHNPQLRWKEMSVVCAGNYECEENPETAEALLLTVHEIAQSLHAEVIIGPMNGSTWDQYRFSLHNDAPNFLLEPYNHVYYNAQFTANEFQTLARYTSRIDYKLPCNVPDILRRKAELTEMGATIRNIDKSRYAEELNWLFPLISKAFSTNFLYSEIRPERFLEKYLAAAPIIEEDFVRVATDRFGEPIGFIFAYRNMLNTTDNQLVVKTIARDPSPQWTGLGHVMGDEVLAAAKSRNYTSVIHAFMIESGTSTGISLNYLGNPYKEYALYYRFTAHAHI